MGKHQDKKDKTAVYKYGGHAHHERVCVACNNSRQCQTCQGDGCAECDYTEVCQECVLWAPTGGEE